MNALPRALNVNPEWGDQVALGADGAEDLPHLPVVGKRECLDWEINEQNVEWEGRLV